MLYLKVTVLITSVQRRFHDKELKLSDFQTTAEVLLDGNKQIDTTVRFNTQQKTHTHTHIASSTSDLVSSHGTSCRFNTLKRVRRFPSNS
eukprot:4821206-Amphidinium_carterae.1